MEHFLGADDERTKTAARCGKREGGAICRPDQARGGEARRGERAWSRCHGPSVTARAQAGTGPGSPTAGRRRAAAAAGRHRAYIRRRSGCRPPSHSTNDARALPSASVTPPGRAGGRRPSLAAAAGVTAAGAAMRQGRTSVLPDDELADLGEAPNFVVLRGRSSFVLARRERMSTFSRRRLLFCNVRA